MIGSIASSTKTAPKQKSAVFFVLLGLLVSGLLLPLLYYATIISFYVSKVEGAVTFYDLWMVIVGGIIY